MTGALGIKRVSAATPGALVCGECGKAWREDITPAGRCPWEHEHKEKQMTMSERTFTVRLSGPQYRALAGAVAERQASLEDNHSTQERGTLERAWNAVQSAWSMGGIG